VNTGAVQCSNAAFRLQTRRLRVEDGRTILYQTHDVDALLGGERNRLYWVACGVGIDEVAAIMVRDADLQCVRTLETGDKDALPRSLEASGALWWLLSKSLRKCARSIRVVIHCSDSFAKSSRFCLPLMMSFAHPDMIVVVTVDSCSCWRRCGEPTTSSRQL
jgi:hypothetical protein